MRINDKKYYLLFENSIGADLQNRIATFEFGNQNRNITYQTQASAVFSSNIEGNTIDLNSFMNYKLSKGKLKPKKEIQEIEDLIKAYEFAQSESLTQINFLKAHKILAKQLVIPSFRGKYRNDKVGVFGSSGLVYLAIEAEFVQEKMNELFDDISLLIKSKLATNEVFYFASLVHLVFVHIHPFRDGNGRVARLLEKWFISEKLGKDFWKLPSEKYYKEHQADYYSNINLGVNYYELDYNKCIPFLLMLPNCLK